MLAFNPGMVTLSPQREATTDALFNSGAPEPMPAPPWLMS